MSDDPKTPQTSQRDAARRAFLKKAGQVAVTTPAVTLLLSAGTKNIAKAGRIIYQVDPPQEDTSDGPFGEDDGVVDGVDEDQEPID